MTGFVKGGLHHASNSINSEDHNLVIKQNMKAKLSPTVHISVLVLPDDSISSQYIRSSNQSEVMNRQSWKTEYVWKTLFTNPVTYTTLPTGALFVYGT